MKHIKLFEKFDVSKIDSTKVAVLEARMENPRTNDEGSTSGTFILDYYGDPSDSQINRATGDYNSMDSGETPYKDVENIIYEVVYGDQNGLKIVENGPLILLIDNSISPYEIEKGMKNYIISIRSLDGMEPIHSDLVFEIH
jgi:hypothetical protein